MRRITIKLSTHRSGLKIELWEGERMLESYWRSADRYLWEVPIGDDTLSFDFDLPEKEAKSDADS